MAFWSTGLLISGLPAGRVPDLAMAATEGPPTGRVDDLDIPEVAPAAAARLEGNVEVLVMDLAGSLGLKLLSSCFGLSGALALTAAVLGVISGFLFLLLLLSAEARVGERGVVEGLFDEEAALFMLTGDLTP